jgi:AGCS family alanine or glycine:cation symporter
MLNQWLENLVGLIWNWPVVGLCVFAGVFFSVFLNFIQIKCIPHAIQLVRGKYDNADEHGQINHFQALSAALSATVGLGNISGVAIAIGLGGPGAVFWMWVMGLLGMATKYVECALGTHYRDEDPATGEVRGGPMQYILKGLGPAFKPMAIIYGTCIFIGAFGAGNMFQAHEAAAAMSQSFNLSPYITGVILALLTGAVIIGGIKRIGNVASKIVPTMCIVYVVGAIAICVMNFELIPNVIAIIFTDAFTGTAAAGGAIGTVIKWGVRRAVFSNEAGLGSAAIAHSAVKTKYPIREGIVASLEPLIDTLIVCTATAMVIIISGFYGAETYREVRAIPITAQTVQASPHWELTSENIPENTSKTQHLLSGAPLLSYQASSAQSDTEFVMIPNIDTRASKALRFSHFKTTGNMRVDLIDDTQNVFATIDLNTGETTGPVELGNKIYKDRWQSNIIRFTGNVPDTIALKFIPQGPDSAWKIDRIQTVEPRHGIKLTTDAFDRSFTGFGSLFISIAVIFFAFSTIISWYYYGETAIAFVLGKRAILTYKIIFVCVTFWGSINKLGMVLNFSDLMLGLMVIPNMIALLFLAPKVKEWTKTYFEDLKNGTLK